MVPATGNSAANGGGGADQSKASGGGGGDGSSSSSGLRKGPWTAEEDAILVDYVKKHGEGNWNAVQKHSGLARCGKSCRLRWANHLRPHLKKGAFSPEEERLIVELHAKFGNKWARMASLLPGRTDNEIKNYWNTRVKRHQRQGLPLYPPDILPQHHHHNQLSSPTTPTTPTSSFSFQTQFSSPSTTLSSPLQPHLAFPMTHTPPPLSPLSSPSTTTASTTFQAPTLHHHHHHLPSSSVHYHSTPTTPTSSFTFQTQSTPPTPPLASPTAANSNASTTLPLFELSLPRTPPILQTPLRFKRFSPACSSSSSVNATSVNNDNGVTLAGTSLNNHFSMPLSPLTPTSMSNNTTPLDQSIPCCFSNLLNSSSSDFHKELQKENEEMRLLFASVTQQQQLQPELPSIQLLSPTSQNNANSGISMATTNTTNTTTGTIMKNKKFGFGINKKKNGNGGLGLMRGGSGMLEDLLREAKALAASGESSIQHCNLITAEEDSKPIVFDGFGTAAGNWDHSNTLALSSELKPNVEAAGQFNTMPQDSTRLLDALPSNMQVELYTHSGDISNGPSSVVTDDNLGFDMQQIASLFPTSADHDRNLGPCWDNLSGIC